MTMYGSNEAPNPLHPYYWMNLEQVLGEYTEARLVDDRCRKGFTYRLEGVDIICDLDINEESEIQEIRLVGQSETRIRQVKTNLSKLLVRNATEPYFIKKIKEEK